MHESAENLKTHMSNAFGVPEHVKGAWNAWVDSVEERLGLKSKDKKEAAADKEAEEAKVTEKEAAEKEVADKVTAEAASKEAAEKEAAANRPAPA